jgi:hypothetical protein
MGVRSAERGVAVIRQHSRRVGFRPIRRSSLNPGTRQGAGTPSCPTQGSRARVEAVGRSVRSRPAVVLPRTPSTVPHPFPRSRTRSNGRVGREGVRQPGRPPAAASAVARLDALLPEIELVAIVNQSLLQQRFRLRFILDDNEWNIAVRTQSVHLICDVIGEQMIEVKRAFEGQPRD